MLTPMHVQVCYPLMDERDPWYAYRRGLCVVTFHPLPDGVRLPCPDHFEFLPAPVLDSKGEPQPVCVAIEDQADGAGAVRIMRDYCALRAIVNRSSESVVKGAPPAVVVVPPAGVDQDVAYMAHVPAAVWAVGLN